MSAEQVHDPDVLRQWEEDGKEWRIASMGSNTGMLVQLAVFLDGSWVSRSAILIPGRLPMRELRERFDAVVANYLLRPEWYRRGCPREAVETRLVWRSPEAKAAFSQQVLAGSQLQKGGE